MTAIKKGEGEGEGRPQNKAIRAPVGANKFQVALFTKTISSWRSKGWSYLASSITSISLFWTMWENSTSTTRMSTFKLLILSKGKSSISAAKATCPGNEYSAKIFSILLWSLSIGLFYWPLPEDIDHMVPWYCLKDAEYSPLNIQAEEVHCGRVHGSEEGEEW